METNRTTEITKKQMMEYFIECYTYTQFASYQNVPATHIYQVALYLYQNATVGPKETKMVAKYLMQLSEALKIEDNQNNIPKILKKLNSSLPHKAIRQWIQEKASGVLKQALQIRKTGKFVNEPCRYLFEQKCAQLQDSQNINIKYECMTEVLLLLEKNREKQQEIVCTLTNAKTKLEVLAKQSRNKNYLLYLANYICELELAFLSNQYSRMQEATLEANAVFAQATRSASYQKQIVKQMQERNMI